MTLWNRLRRAWRSITLADFQQIGILDPPSVAGPNITPYSALNFSAFWNAVHVISSQVATLPRILYRRLEDDSRERATTHPAYRVLIGEPNPTSTPYVFWQTLVAHALTWGNGYAEIEFDRALRPIALWPITPDLIEPQVERKALADGRVTYSLWYRYKGSRRLEAEDVLHVPGLGFDGVKGYSVVSMARQSIGLGIAAEQFGAAFFNNGAYPGVVLEHPGKLSADAQNRLKVSWSRDSRGPNALGVQVAEEGMKVNKIGIPPDDAQFLETREFQVVEIARWFNIPPHKLKHRVGERPGGNIEASQIEFLTDTLYPWLISIEQECDRKLIAKNQRATYYVEHMTNALLRPDAKTRSEIQRAYFDMGVIDAETIARQENLPKPKPKPAPAPVEDEPKKPDDKPKDEPEGEGGEDEGEGDDARARARRAWRLLCLDVASRFVRRETFHMRRAAKMGDDFPAWVARFYGEEEAKLRELVAPVVAVILAIRGCADDPGLVAAGIAAAYVDRSRKALHGIPAPQLEDGVAALAGRWETARAIELADQLAAIAAPDRARAAA